MGESQQSRALAPALRYLAAGGAVAIAFALRAALGPFLGEHASFLLFIPPVLAAALYFGVGPALFAAVLSLLAGVSFSSAPPWSSTSIAFQAALFALVCLGMIWMGWRLTRQGRMADLHRRTAQGEAARAHAAGEELRLLLEGATQYAIFMVDSDGAVTTWNAGAARIFGWAESEIIGRNCSVFYPAEEANGEKPEADLAQAEAEGRFAEESWQARKDGSEFLADITITPIRDGEGRLLGFAKVIHDVTDRRAAERALEKRERHLQSILATVPDAMIVIDEHGLMISFSAAAERLFGYSEAEVLGCNVSMLMPNPDRDRHDSYLERYLASGEPHIIGIGRIVTGLRRDGSTFPMKLSVGEALSDEQRLFTGFVQDLTERKDFEARLEQLKSELIHVSRLSAMGTMASTLAHELNQPLTAISTYGEAAAELLDGEEPPEKELLREVFEDMSAQALRAGTIVRRLREFVARGEIAKTVEDLPALINEASALALVGSREKGISAQFSYSPEATPVLADRVQVQQVLMNLMRNAIEAMEGCPTRKLMVSTTLIDPDTVEVSVADTGPGIAPDMHDRLFEAFASTKSNGMGLGLSICRTIIEGHGGRIRARDAQGGGTEFLFTLVRPAAEPTP